MRAVLLGFLLCSCATAEDPIAVRSDAGGDVRDTAVVPTDTMSMDDTGVGDDTAAPPSDTSGSCHLVINELQTGDGSSGNADFVEIFNPCSSSASLNNFKLVYRSSSGTTDTVLFTFSSMSIASKGFRVIGGTAFSGSKDGALASGLAVGGASVGLRDASDTLIDSVGYGSATGALVEGSAAPAPTDSTPAKSIARVPDATDSDNNASDFKVGTPTPGATNG
jgi:uncharacterized protein